MNQEKKLTLEGLLAAARQAIAARAKSKAAAQQAGTIRRQEIGNLEWPIDNRAYWTPFEIRIIYERQVCECCEGDQMSVHQELVGFQSTKVAGARRWLRYRGEAIENQLPTSCEIIERHVPQCWQCHTLERHLDNLWSILDKKEGVSHHEA